LTARITTVPRDEIAVTVISVEEQMDGRLGQIRQAQTLNNSAEILLAYDNLATTAEALSRLPIIRLTAAGIARYETLRAMKLNVGPKDLRIAAIALEQGAIVITRNRRDFERIPGITVEDWTESVP
jgi:tRNA(fMet)-specific endonuclease VapC